MTVYVDDMHRREANSRYAYTRRWSHLLADTSTELRAMAGRLGLSDNWLQHAGTPREHYDVTDSFRRHAIILGAVQISYLRETPALTIAKRHGVPFDLAGLRAGTWRPDTTPSKETPEP